MSYLTGTLSSVALLWLLITFFTRATSSSGSLTETWIVIIGMQIVRFFSRLLLAWAIGPFVLLIELAALYILAPDRELVAAGLDEVKPSPSGKGKYLLRDLPARSPHLFQSLL